MSSLLQFVFGMLICSTLLAGLGLIVAASGQRVRHWPAFWAMLLVVAVAIPALGLGMAAMPFSRIADLPSLPYLNVPMDALDSVMISSTADVGPPFSDRWQMALTAFALIYLAGVLLQLLKLLFGRRRVARIARLAVPINSSTHQVYWLAGVDCGSDSLTPFAYTPFGQPGRSRIVVPAEFAEQLSAAELSDVLDHERAHVARRDDEVGVILRVLRAFCWLSPAALLLFARWSRSIEVQCDLEATHGRTPRMRKAYAATLLKALHITANRVLAYPAASFSTHRLRSEQMRIECILTGQATAFKQLRHHVLLGALAISTTVVGAASLSARAASGTDKAASAAASSIGSMLNGRLSARFGNRTDPFNAGATRQHNGIDVVAPVGTEIMAPADGVIVAATDLYDDRPNYGKVVVIETDGELRTLLAHLDGYPVRVGQSVRKGEAIATVGMSGKTTGPHVHIETFRSGERVDPETVWFAKR